ncbi:MAG: M23 family metallopeptidase [Firmicutes bacterium]|nr:M23 family metallopeptidase [Bacillota bacterium]
MNYLRVVPEWAPYALMKDRRGFISRCFGNGHTGVDSVGNEYGNRVCAVTGGTVGRVYTSPALGNVVEYGAGNIRIAYYHLAKALVRAGETVQAGKTAIGVEGSTGSLASGKHLHVSLWIDGVLTDPEPYLCGKKRWPAGAVPAPQAAEEETKMKYTVGDAIRVNGKIAPSAYSKEGTVFGSGRVLTITRIYEGTNFPYQCGMTGFVREEDIVPAQGSQTVGKAEYDRVCSQLAAAQKKLEAVRAALG